MAIFNEILVGRFNHFLQKFYGIKGGPPAAQLSTEIGTQLELQSGVENWYLQKILPFGISILQTAGAGNVLGIMMRNPAGSNMVAIVARLDLGGTSELDISYGPAGNDLATAFAQTQTCLDGRGQTPGGTLNAQSHFSFNLVNPPGLQQLIIRAQSQVANRPEPVIIHADEEIPLLPGFALQVTTTVAATQLITNWGWRERPLEEGERF